MSIKSCLQSGPDQLAYVTSDLSRAKEELGHLFGVDRFLEPGAVPTLNQRFDSQSEPMSVSVALAWTGTLFLEIICPTSRDIIYGECLSHDGFTLAFHHTACRVRHWADFLGKIAAEGRNLRFSGEVPNVAQFGFLDTRQTLGHYVEYFALADQGERLWQAIRTGDF